MSKFGTKLISEDPTIKQAGEAVGVITQVSTTGTEAAPAEVKPDRTMWYIIGGVAALAVIGFIIFKMVRK